MISIYNKYDNLNKPIITPLLSHDGIVKNLQEPAESGGKRIASKEPPEKNLLAFDGNFSATSNGDLWTSPFNGCWEDIPSNSHLRVQFEGNDLWIDWYLSYVI